MKSETPTAFEMFCGASATSAREQEELERLFFVSVRLPNGTFKTTNERRLDDLNALVNAHLPEVRPLRIMDVAVSSGISTAEWLESLAQMQIPCDMVAGDLTARGFIVSAGFGLRVLTDTAATPLQFDVRGRVVRVDAGWRQRVLYALPLLWLRLASRIFGLLRGSVGVTPGHAERQRVAGLEVRPVRLLSKRLNAFTNLQVVDDDISMDGHHPSEFHVLRAANILNLIYFDRQTLLGMVLNLRRRLQVGGLLVICRTLDNGVNHGTVFRMGESGAFDIVARLNDGSEIEELVLTSGRLC